MDMEDIGLSDKGRAELEALKSQEDIVSDAEAEIVKIMDMVKIKIDDGYDDFRKTIDKTHLQIIKAKRPNNIKWFPQRSVRLLTNHIDDYFEYLGYERVEPPKFSNNPLASFSDKLYLFKESEEEQIYLLQPSGWVFEITINGKEIRYKKSGKKDWFDFIQYKLQKKYPNTSFDTRSEILENVEIFTQEIHMNQKEFERTLKKEYLEVSEAKSENDVWDLIGILQDLGKTNYHLTKWWVLYNMAHTFNINYCQVIGCNNYSNEIHHVAGCYTKTIGKEDEFENFMTVLCSGCHRILHDENGEDLKFLTIDEFEGERMTSRLIVNNIQQKNNDTGDEMTTNNDLTEEVIADNEECEKEEVINLNETERMRGLKGLYAEMISNQNNWNLRQKKLAYILKAYFNGNGKIPQVVKEELAIDCELTIRTIDRALVAINEAPLDGEMREMAEGNMGLSTFANNKQKAKKLKKENEMTELMADEGKELMVEEGKRFSTTEKYERLEKMKAISTYMESLATKNDSQSAFEVVLSEYIRRRSQNINVQFNEALRKEIQDKFNISHWKVYGGTFALENAPISVLQEIADDDTNITAYYREKNVKSRHTDNKKAKKRKIIKKKENLSLENVLKLNRVKKIKSLREEMLENVNNLNKKQMQWINVISAFVRENGDVKAYVKEMLAENLKKSIGTIGKAINSLETALFDDLELIADGYYGLSTHYENECNRKKDESKQPNPNNCKITQSCVDAMKAVVELDIDEYTNTELVKLTGASISTIGRAIKIYEFGDKNIIRDVLEKRLSISHAMEIIEEKKKTIKVELIKKENNTEEFIPSAQNSLHDINKQLIPTNESKQLIQDSLYEEENDINKILMEEREKSLVRAEQIKQILEKQSNVKEDRLLFEEEKAKVKAKEKEEEQRIKEREEELKKEKEQFIKSSIK